MNERASRDPEIVVKEPLGSVDTEGGMLVTGKLCDAELEGSVSIEPDIVVRKPFGSVDVIGEILVTDALWVLEFGDINSVGEVERVSVDPEIVGDPSGSVNVVGGMAVTERLAGKELREELEPLDGFMLPI